MIREHIIGFGFGMFMAAAIALTIAAQSAQALPTGDISFFGNVTPYLSSTGIGTQASDYISARALVFGPTVAALNADGVFSIVPANTPITMYSPLEINPPQLPIPATSPVWQVTAG